MTPFAVAAFIFVLNLPFGYWRSGLEKFSLRWFLAIHVPIVPAVGLRLWLEVPWSPGYLALSLGAFFGGQLVGARVLPRLAEKVGSE